MKYSESVIEVLFHNHKSVFDSGSLGSLVKNLNDNWLRPRKF
jgi:hypothetical protein